MLSVSVGAWVRAGGVWNAHEAAWACCQSRTVCVLRVGQLTEERRVLSLYVCA